MEAPKHTSYYYFLIAIVGAYVGNLTNLFPEGAIPVTLFQIGLAIGILGYSAQHLFDQNLYFKIPPYLTEGVLLLAVLTISVIYSNNREVAIFYLIRIYVLLIFAYLLFNALNSMASIHRVANIILGVAVLIALYGIFKMLLNPGEIAQNITSTATGVKNRAIGVEEDPNAFASYFIFPFFFLLAKYYSSKNKWKKTFFLALTGIITVIVIITYSRSVMLSLALGTAILLFIKRDFKIPIILLSAIIIATISSESVRLLLESVFERLGSIVTGQLDDSSSIRIILFIGALEMFTGSYGLGVGLRGFPEYFRQNYDLQQTIGAYEPHNVYYQILAEQGIIGFLLFMFLFCMIGYTLYRNYQWSENAQQKDLNTALMLTFIGYAIFSLFIGGAITDSRIYVLGALIFSIYHIYSIRPKSIPPA